MQESEIKVSMIVTGKDTFQIVYRNEVGEEQIWDRTLCPGDRMELSIPVAVHVTGAIKQGMAEVKPEPIGEPIIRFLEWEGNP